MLRWYCWLIFFTIAIFSTWALPADEENGMTEGPIIDADGNDQEVMDITSRYFRRKPNKYRDDDSSSSSWENDKEETKVKCVCLGKKPFAYTLERYPPPRPSRNLLTEIIDMDGFF